MLADVSQWPDAVDWFALGVISALLVGAPLLGYVLLVLDIRAYYRSLRRALVTVRGYATRLPDWVRRDRPPCLEALGLTLPCTQQEVLAAYRERVKRLHPDAGGSRTQFAQLQQHFEQAMQLAKPGS
ncbi:MAG: J domain-containing protein [Planctomycetota bacterium]